MFVVTLKEDFQETKRAMVVFCVVEIVGRKEVKDFVNLTH
jgi:hypothetical protein